MIRQSQPRATIPVGQPIVTILHPSIPAKTAQVCMYLFRPGSESGTRAIRSATCSGNTDQPRAVRDRCGYLPSDRPLLDASIAVFIFRRPPSSLTNFPNTANGAVVSFHGNPKDLCCFLLMARPSMAERWPKTDAPGGRGRRDPLKAS